MKEKVSRSTLLSKFKARETDTVTQLNDEINIFKRELKIDFQRELDKMKIDYDTQIKQVRSGWVGAFGNMKNAFKEVFTDLRGSIDRLEIDNCRAITTVPGGLSGGPQHDID